MGRSVQPCGTYAAYRRHLRSGELVDAECQQAARDQKNVRVETARKVSGEIVALAIVAEPVIEVVDELDELRENLRVVKATMSDGAPHNTIAALSKRRQELVERIAQLERASKPGVSALDQLARRRADRLAASAH